MYKRQVLELHEPNTTKTVNNIIPTNSFIFILYDFIYDSTLKVYREEPFEDYVRYGQELGIEVIRNEAFQIDGINISSSCLLYTSLNLGPPDYESVALTN